MADRGLVRVLGAKEVEQGLGAGVDVRACLAQALRQQRRPVRVDAVDNARRAHGSRSRRRGTVGARDAPQRRQLAQEGDEVAHATLFVSC
jgi:hypothetical protein